MACVGVGVGKNPRITDDGVVQRGINFRVGQNNCVL